jgi:transcription-repair coupling factor (superfamily II helicase)
MERIILKKRKMQCYFISNPSSSFFETQLFQNILKFVASYQGGKEFTMKQSNSSLILIKEDVKTLQHAWKLLQVIYDDTAVD